MRSSLLGSFSSTQPILTLFCGLTLVVMAGACPADSGPSCQDCTPGEAVCKGNYTRICDSDGKSYRHNFCGRGQYCVNGVCTTRACSNLGGGSCIDTSTLSQCDLQGAGQTTVSCAASEVCAGGACVPGQCVEGQTRCGDFYTTLSCTAGAWVASSCDGTDVCAIGSDGEAACEPARCVAQSARCDGNVSVLCNADGSTETRTSCASNEICDAGWCRVKICGEELSTPSSSDAAQSNDAGTDNDGGSKPTPDVFIPPLEPLPVLTFKFGASAKEYNLNVRADYIATEKALKIQGGKSGERIEITMSPIDPATLGLYTDTDSSETVVQFCYFNGIDNDEVSPCPVGFSHASIGYAVDVTANNGPGSRVQGTFSATLKDRNGQTVNVSDGVFDVKHF